MFGYRIPLGRLFGFPLAIDLSWFIIAIFLTWSLAAGLFPSFYPDLPVQVYWVMGAAGAIGLFASIVLHELAHALVARGFGLPMGGITLFIFGGVAEMREEPPSPKAEFFVAVAGPIASILIAGLCYVGYVVATSAAWPASVQGVLGYLAWINAVLVAFNLVPAFPLDGGRMLRAGLWKMKKSLRWATRVTSSIGAGFGLALIVLGVLMVFSGNLIGALWWVLIGMFLRSAAQLSYQQLLVRRALEGEPVRRFMQPAPITVTPQLSVAQLVEEHIYRDHHKMYPVTVNGDLLGCVTTRNVKDVPRAEWAQRRVEEILSPCTPENVVDPDEDAMEVMSRMSRADQSRLLVARDRQLFGIITLKDLLKFISLKLELEDGGRSPTAARAILARSS